MDKFCDLHTHSYYSDGTCSPRELLQQAERLGLSAIALTDHNTVAGLGEFWAAGEHYNVEAIGGIEITSEFEGEELHILGLFLPPESLTSIEEVMGQVRMRKARSERALVDALREKGMDLSYEAIQKVTPDGNINRAHIATEMVKKGYVSTYREAFATWLSPEWGLYHPAKRLDAFEVIRLIKSVGAAAVLAHPFLSLQEEPLRRFLGQAVQHGLDGMETMYSKYNDETTALSSQIAREFDILPSGGSDFHGGNKPDVRMGTGQGTLQVPVSVIPPLKDRTAIK